MASGAGSRGAPAQSGPGSMGSVLATAPAGASGSEPPHPSYELSWDFAGRRGLTSEESRPIRPALPLQMQRGLALVLVAETGWDRGLAVIRQEPIVLAGPVPDYVGRRIVLNVVVLDRVVCWVSALEATRGRQHDPTSTHSILL